LHNPSWQPLKTPCIQRTAIHAWKSSYWSKCIQPCERQLRRSVSSLGNLHVKSTVRFLVRKRMNAGLKLCHYFTISNSSKWLKVMKPRKWPDWQEKRIENMSEQISKNGIKSWLSRSG
jgi:hypothetical protein